MDVLAWRASTLQPREGLGQMCMWMGTLLPATTPGERSTCTMLATTIIDIPDPYPESARRITTSLALRPEDHLHIARMALELGIDRSSLMRRGLVASGLIPSTPSTEVVHPRTPGEDDTSKDGELLAAHFGEATLQGALADPVVQDTEEAAGA